MRLLTLVSVTSNILKDFNFLIFFYYSFIPHIVFCDSTIIIIILYSFQNHIATHYYSGEKVSNFEKKKN